MREYYHRLVQEPRLPDGLEEQRQEEARAAAARLIEIGGPVIPFLVGQRNQILRAMDPESVEAKRGGWRSRSWPPSQARSLSPCFASFLEAPVQGSSKRHSWLWSTSRMMTHTPTGRSMCCTSVRLRDKRRAELGTALLAAAVFLAAGPGKAQQAAVPALVNGPVGDFRTSLGRLKLLRPVDGLRRAEGFQHRLLEARVIEAVEQTALGQEGGAGILAQTLAEGSYMAQMTAAFRAGKHAGRGKPLPDRVGEELEKLTSPPLRATELGRMAHYALNVREWAGLPVAQRVARYEQLLREEPAYARVLLQHWEYQLPAWAPPSWAEHGALRSGLRTASPALLYYRTLVKENPGAPELYADILLGRVEEGYRRLRALHNPRPEDPAVLELQALAQRLIDLGEVAVERIGERPDLLRRAAAAPTGTRAEAGYRCVPDVLRGVGDARALPLLFAASPGRQGQVNGRLGETSAWVMRRVRYPYRAIHLYRWTAPPPVRPEVPVPPVKPKS